MKMVIDSHAHIGNLWVLNLNVRKVLWSMEQYGVDFSLVSSIESTEYYEKGKHLPWPLRKTTMCVCRKTVRAVKRHPDKLGALLWIQPLYRKEQAIYLRHQDPPLPLRGRSGRSAHRACL